MFDGDIGETAAMNVSENYQKNVFSSVSSCPIHSPTTIPKRTSTVNVSFAWSQNFQNFWESVCVGSLFSKIKETSVFCNSAGKFKPWIVCFKKSPFNRSCRLTEYNFQIFKTISKFLKVALKLTENSQEIICNGFPYREFTDVQVLALDLRCM